MTPFPETVSDPHRPHFFRWRELGYRFKSRRATSSFFFFHRQFYPSAFYCLFSLLPLLASRDFCENVFLVERGSLLCCIFGRIVHICSRYYFIWRCDRQECERAIAAWRWVISFSEKRISQRALATKKRSPNCQRDIEEYYHCGLLSSLDVFA